jgi:competence protein ComEC
MSAASADSPVAVRARPRPQPLVPLVVAVCSGIVLDRWTAIPIAVWWGTAVLLLAAWCAAAGWRLVRAAAVVLLGGAAAAGGAWHHWHWHLYRSDELGLAAREGSQPICLAAIACTSPRRVAPPPPNPLRTMPVGERSELAIEVIGVRDGTQWRRASGRAELLVDGQLLGVQAGDRVHAFALFSRPAVQRNPGEFDFAAHFRIERQLFRCSAQFPDMVTVAARGSVWHWRRGLATVRDRGSAALWKHLQRRQAGLAAALLLGAREQLDRERTREFLTSGTIHLLSVSGVHVNILAAGFWWLLRCFPLGRRAALFAVMAFVVGYALLTDANPPVVRAAILTVTFCVARLFGRPAASYNTLAAAGLVVVALNPASLFQAGTQLSFLAVLTIIVSGPHILRAPSTDPLDRLVEQSQPWLVRAGRRILGVTWQITALSGVIWIVTTPLSAYRFHVISPIGMPLNPLVALPVSVALFSGFGVLVCGWLLPPLGHLCGWVCNVSLACLEWLVEYAQVVPGGYWWTGGPAWWWVAGLYLGWGLTLAFPRLRLPRRWALAIVTAWLAVGTCSTQAALRAWGFPPCGRLACTFAAVGHGAGVVVELPNRQTLLYDAGTMGSPDPAVQALSAVLWTRGITHLDAVVLSHADADHYNALPELLGRFSVGAVYVSSRMFAEMHAAAADPSAGPARRREERASLTEGPPPLEVLREAIERSGVPLRVLRLLDRARTPAPAAIEVLHPPEPGYAESDNANSVVLSITQAGRRLLLTGDLAAPGLQDLTSDPLSCDVLMVPHHGSKGSDPARLAQWCAPRWAVISGALRDPTDTVEDLYAAQGAAVLHTARRGAVQFSIDDDGTIGVETWRPGPGRP